MSAWGGGGGGHHLAASGLWLPALESHPAVPTLPCQLLSLEGTESQEVLSPLLRVGHVPWGRLWTQHPAETSGTCTSVAVTPREALDQAGLWGPPRPHQATPFWPAPACHLHMEHFLSRCSVPGLGVHRPKPQGNPADRQVLQVHGSPHLETPTPPRTFTALCVTFYLCPPATLPVLQSPCVCVCEAALQPTGASSLCRGHSQASVATPASEALETLPWCWGEAAGTWRNGPLREGGRARQELVPPAAHCQLRLSLYIYLTFSKYGIFWKLFACFYDPWMWLGM